MCVWSTWIAIMDFIFRSRYNHHYVKCEIIIGMWSVDTLLHEVFSLFGRQTECSSFVDNAINTMQTEKSIKNMSNTGAIPSSHHVEIKANTVNIQTHTACTNVLRLIG